ncbi:hypothetical protein SAMN05444354_12437 [Stigmatella aurantiaca]|uniref:BREX system P-loop protein BrxC n=1 Tax=Stigmatella aurantiaca TaxID=41 RepID=A0A1H8BPV8_STIAU|nr:BREX system P-loop protein BrxC [Stigmatella aurantiaca]SEM84164.1 hypothetical protein SAMN05444354_12437 [Stigmatella aurantiaca]
MIQVRQLFSNERDIERTIEKVIDYYEDRPEKLDREIGEYVVTERLEHAYRQFIESFDAGVRLGDASEVGIWVSGFYGSGKSSFTKYLGFALGGDLRVGRVPFHEKLAALFKDQQLAQDLRRLSQKMPATIVFLDLARDQLIQNSAEPITNVLYAKVLDFVGYSKVPKLAEVEYRLDKDGRYEAFQQAYRAQFPGKGEWSEVHDDPLLGPARGAKLVSVFFPDDFPTPESFRTQNFQLSLTVDDIARRVVELLRRKKGRDVIVFLVDEVGQYVAPSTSLMLNLDGLVRSFKEVGRGKVWFVATAQQALDTIVDKAILNSAELYRLKDRFRPITLDAADIREITYKRLLTKSSEGEKRVSKLFRDHTQQLQLHTRVEGFGAGRALDAQSFTQMYPFLPVHFDVVMELIRRLARRTGGTGLRSAIRVIQDLLVDPTGSMKELTPIARREFGTLATAEDIYDGLRNDLGKEYPHVVEGVDRVMKHDLFGKNVLAVRIAKAIAALQPLEHFPRTAENLAALLFPKVDAPSHAESVREVLRGLVDTRELGIVEVRAEDAGDDAIGGSGFLFLSDRVRPYQSKRDEHRPTGGEKRQFQVDILRELFDPLPRTQLAGARWVSGGLWLGSTMISGSDADVRFMLEPVEPRLLEHRKDELLNETRVRSDYAAKIIWLVHWPPELDDDLTEACRSAHIVKSVPEHEADRDVAQFLRAEKRRLERRREAAAERMKEAMREGWLVFRGIARAVVEHGADALTAAQHILDQASQQVFKYFHLAPINAKTDLAARFLEVDRLDRITRDRDPLQLVQVRAGRPSLRHQESPLADVLREFKEKVDAAGTGRLQGSFVQDLFAAPPFGWPKDTTRYLFAALLVAGDVEFHTADGVLRTAGPKSADAVKNTAAFNRIGIAPRGIRPPLDALDRAARQLEGLFGIEVLPLEDHISRAVRVQIPPLMERVGSLPDRLRLLELPGEARARKVLQGCADLIQEDAGGAASLLGAPDNPLPDDIRWAKSVVDCLESGGEAQFRRASALRRDVGELASLFPEVVDLVDDPSMQQVAETLDSDTIFERLPALRNAVLSLESALAERYVRAVQSLEGQVRAAREALSANPLWKRISADDQAQLFALLPKVPSAQLSDPAAVVNELRRVLTTEAKVSGIVRAIEIELPTRIPQESEPGPKDEPEESPSGARVQLVRVRELLPDGVLVSATDIDKWLTQTRERLLAVVEFGPVRLAEGE